MRDRPEDIPLLVDHFVRRNRQGIPPHAVVTVTQCMEVLTGHRWPGNVRELANVVEHALVLSDELPLQIKDLPERLRRENDVETSIETQQAADPSRY